MWQFPGVPETAHVAAVFTAAIVGAHSISPHTCYSTANALSGLFAYDETTFHCPTQPVGLTAHLSLTQPPPSHSQSTVTSCLPSTPPPTTAHMYSAH